MKCWLASFKKLYIEKYPQMLKAIKLLLESLEQLFFYLLKLNILMNVLRSSASFLKKTSISCSQDVTIKSYVTNK